MNTFAAANYERHNSSAKNVLYSVLNSSSQVWDLRCKIRKFTEEIFFIKEKFKLQIDSNRGKLVHLQVLFDREAEHMISILLKKN